MADKNIAELPEVAAVTDDTLIPVWQPGAADEAQSMTGQQFREFAEASVKPYSDSAVQAALTAAGCEAGAQQAWTGVQNAIKNIPAGSTPIVNDLNTGGATMALSAEQGKLLGRRPNPKLVDNWYFPDPINQRGLTECATSGYFIDRWQQMGNVTKETIVDGGIKAELLTANASYKYALYQTIENPERFVGKEITVSALVTEFAGANNYIKISCRNSERELKSIQTKITSPDIVSVTGVVPEGTTIIWVAPFIFTANSAVGDYIVEKAVKLELGNVQTLAHVDADGNWVLNDPPPHPQQEMAKCQRYFRSLRGGVPSSYANFGIGIAYSTTEAYIYVPCNIPMRITPTFSAKGNLRLSANAGANLPAVTALTAGANSSGALLRIKVTVASGLTAGGMVVLQANNDATADVFIDANL